MKFASDDEPSDLEREENGANEEERDEQADNSHEDSKDDDAT